MTADRGRETGVALTEIRTVLSRAETARSTILNIDESRVFPKAYPSMFDPDRDEMVQALDDFIAAAGRWARTGRTR